MLFCHLVITVCACTFATCTLIKINQSIIISCAAFTVCFVMQTIFIVQLRGWACVWLPVQTLDQTNVMARSPVQRMMRVASLASDWSTFDSMSTPSCSSVSCTPTSVPHAKCRCHIPRICIAQSRHCQSV